MPDTTETPWADLATVLRETRFGQRSWTALAASADRLLRELGRERPPHHSPRAADIQKHIQQLTEIIVDACHPSAGVYAVRRACADADLFRGWLLQLLELSQTEDVTE